jgi:hypothetical protein
LGAALDHALEAKAEAIELVADGLNTGQLPLGVALALDELLADFWGGEAAVQPGSLEGGVGLEVVLD